MPIGGRCAVTPTSTGWMPTRHTVVAGRAGSPRGIGWGTVPPVMGVLFDVGEPTGWRRPVTLSTRHLTTPSAVART